MKQPPDRRNPILESHGTTAFWDNPAMDELESALRNLLAASDVDPADKSSILHHLASDMDAIATS